MVHKHVFLNDMCFNLFHYVQYSSINCLFLCHHHMRKLQVSISRRCEYTVKLYKQLHHIDTTSVSVFRVIYSYISFQCLWQYFTCKFNNSSDIIRKTKNRKYIKQYRNTAVNRSVTYQISLIPILVEYYHVNFRSFNLRLVKYVRRSRSSKLFRLIANQRGNQVSSKSSTKSFVLPTNNRKFSKQIQRGKKDSSSIW